MPKFLINITFLICTLAVSSSAFSYGSLAIDSNQGDSWGFSYDYDNVDDADARALNECGSNCRIVKNFKTGCGAYAADQATDGTAYGWGTAPTEDEAKETAIEYCEEYGGTDCIIRVWSCNSD